ncbi:MAG: PD-(D/E)XK nuclease family protein [Elusimicrobia bacterium]|nr:PD-(D/E)XK nuclease family protein [Elusimicrobiota bacterium]
MRPLSHSSIGMYIECPMKWHFRYVQKVPEKPKHFFSFGKSIHDALEYFYGVKTLPPPSIEEVLQYYSDHWLTEGYKDPKQEAEYKEQGRAILREYHKKHIDQFRIPYFVEYGFNLEVDGVKVTGFVDRIDKVGDDRIAILDYKTGKAFPKDAAVLSDQLTMYQMACEQLLGMKVERLTLYHLPSQTPVTSEPHSQSQVDALRERIVKVHSDIKGNLAKLERAEIKHFPTVFERSPEFSKQAKVSAETTCHWCDFKPLCPAWEHAYGKPAAAPEPEALKDDAKIAKLIDRYGKLHDQLKELEEKAEELKDQIVASLGEKGYVRAFGERYSATVRHDERWEFGPENKKTVLDAIRGAGYWDRVTGPLAAKVQELMRDPGLPMDLRDRLQRMGKKVESATLRIKKVSEES